jgi:tetratricopeptide (TPR) repeat protein
LTNFEIHGKLCLSVESTVGVENAMETVASLEWVDSGRNGKAGRRIGVADAFDILSEQMQRLDISHDLLPVAPQAVAHQASIRTYDPGDVILRAGARADCLGLLVEGQVAACSGGPGDAGPPAILTPGHSFGQEMLAQGRASTVTLQAITRCEVWFVRRADLALWAGRHGSEGLAPPLWVRLSQGALWLLVALAAILALGLPSTRQALALVPMGLGQWCEAQQHDLCAVQAWTLAAAMAPRETGLRLALGVHYAEQGQLAAAQRLFSAAEVWAPESAEIQNDLGYVHAQQGELEPAVAAFLRALELAPGVSAVEQNLGFSLQALGAYDEALAHYQPALARDEPPASTLVNVAIAYYEAGQLAEADGAARQALAYDEVRVPAYTVLGAVALEQGQPEAALADLSLAVALDPGYAPAQLYLGLAYQVLAKPARAAAALETALAAVDDEDVRARIRLRLSELGEDESGSVDSK